MVWEGLGRTCGDFDLDLTGPWHRDGLIGDEDRKGEAFFDDDGFLGGHDGEGKTAAKVEVLVLHTANRTDCHIYTTLLTAFAFAAASSSHSLPSPAPDARQDDNIRPRSQLAGQQGATISCLLVIRDLLDVMQPLSDRRSSPSPTVRCPARTQKELQEPEETPIFPITLAV